MTVRPGQRTSPYTVREVRDPPREEWDDRVENSPGGGHVLQSYTWAEVKRVQGWRPLRLLLERGDEVVGAGQFLLYDTLPVPGRLMYCTKGPWLPWDEQRAVQAFFEGTRRIAERERAHRQGRARDLRGTEGRQAAPASARLPRLPLRLELLHHHRDGPLPL